MCGLPWSFFCLGYNSDFDIFFVLSLISTHELSSLAEKKTLGWEIKVCCVKYAFLSLSDGHIDLSRDKSDRVLRWPNMIRQIQVSAGKGNVTYLFPIDLDWKRKYTWKVWKKYSLSFSSFLHFICVLLSLIWQNNFPSSVSERDLRASFI